MSQTTEDRLIQAGRQLLEENGISAVTVREVARRCGVSHGAPRRHFPTLALLLAAITEACLGELRERIADAGGSLKETARAYVAYAIEHPHAFDLITRHDVLAGSGRELRARSLPLLEEWRARFAKERPDAPEAAATAAWAAVHGVASLASRGALDLVGSDAEELLEQLLPQA